MPQGNGQTHLEHPLPNRTVPTRSFGRKRNRRRKLRIQRTKHRTTIKMHPKTPQTIYHKMHQGRKQTFLPEADPNPEGAVEAEDEAVAVVMVVPAVVEAEAEAAAEAEAEAEEEEPQTQQNLILVGQREGGEGGEGFEHKSQYHSYLPFTNCTEIFSTIPPITF